MPLAKTDTRASKRRRLDNKALPSPELPSGATFSKSLGLPSQYAKYLEECADTTPLKRRSSRSPSDDGNARAAGDLGVKEEHKPAEVASQCCFGMLSEIPIRPRTTVSMTTSNIPLVFHYPNSLSPKGQSDLNFEITSDQSARVLGELHNVKEITTQLYCVAKLGIPLEKKRPGNGKKMGQTSYGAWVLNTIIYGPLAIEERLGEYLTKHKMYLQDPLSCDRCVPYRNPHIIMESDEVMTTDQFDSVPRVSEIERIDSGPDLLAQLMVDEVPLPETDGPGSVRTALFRHQKQALTFMLRREQGWAMGENDGDIWSKKMDASGQFRFINNVSGSYQKEPPPSFQGGLLADEMGLGKTLTMISLIATNATYQDLSPPSIISRSLEKISCPPVKTTLLVVPPPLMQAWEKQFLTHVRPGALKIHIYHGQNRKGMEFLAQFDVVITTFHTISAIWRKLNVSHKETQNSIFDTTWHRLVLDEAHTIQNMQSQLTQACCALRSRSRWAITGTPIQNKLSDFASLVKFLRVYPYSDLRTFEEDILRPWRGGEPEGFLRLKSLVQKITISRTKAVILLPPRVDEIHHLEFSPAEREAYETAKKESLTFLEKATLGGSGGTMAFLACLNMLRRMCSNGVLEPSRSITRILPVSTSNEAAFSNLDALLEGSRECSQCGLPILGDLPEASPLTLVDTLCAQCGHENHPWYLDQEAEDHDELFNYPKTPRSDLSSSAAIDAAIEAAHTHIEKPSTKIEALLADLLRHESSEKSAVFSYWTSTLDLIQLHLDGAGIRYTQIDGRTSLPKRSEALREFQCNDFTRVILVSITCGGAGLDLTAASRVYLLEPHWNPMIEEQALSRVHRVGQKRNVTTIRYLMRDSFEEQVRDLQLRKKLLAEVAFNTAPLSKVDIEFGRLQYLKSVLG